MPCYNKTIMGIFTHFGQTFSQADYTNTSNGTMDDATAAALMVIILFATLIIAIVSYVIVGLALMQIFKKAGVKPWIAWVPFYNSWKMLEIGGQGGYWAVLNLIPFVSIVSAVFMYISMYHISKKLGKDDSFILWGIFLPLVWYIWLAVDQSQWNDAASTAPSLAK